MEDGDMGIRGYQSRGPLTDTGEISSYEVGVYVVLCLISGHPRCVVYIGTSEGGGRADVTPTGNLQYTIENHEK